MTFEQIDYFIAIIKTGTFFNAAETLHISQSALSKQIMKLEKELDIQLFDRSKRSASLTEAGKVFYEETLILSRQYHQTLLHMRQFKELNNSKLCLGTLPILTQYHFTSLLKDFSKNYPQITICMEEVEEQELMEKLSEDYFNLGIVRSHMLDSTKYDFHLLTEDSLSAILPAAHPLASKKSVSLNDLAYEKFLLMKPHTSIYQLCIKLFREAQIIPNIIRTARMESLLSAVNLWEGISLLPERSFHIFQHKDLVSIPVKPSPTLSVGIAVKKGHSLSPATREFLLFAKKYKTIRTPYLTNFQGSIK